MVGKKISELPAVTAVTANNLSVAVTGLTNNVSSKITIGNLANSFISSDATNLLKQGADDFLSVVAGDAASTDATNLIGTGTDDGLILEATNLVSSDADNIVTVGSDNKLYAAATSGAGDVSSSETSSVDGEIVLFDSTTGKLIKAATGSGIVRATSGVYSVDTVDLADMTTIVGNAGKYIGYNDSTGVVEAKTLPTISLTNVYKYVGKAIKTDTSTITGVAWNGISGLSYSLTPSASGKVYRITAVVNGSNATGALLTLRAGGTNITVGDSAGSRIPSSCELLTLNTGDVVNKTIVSHYTSVSTSPITIDVAVWTIGGTTYINRSTGDVDSTSYTRCASTIEIEELQ